ncbi:MAG: HAD-IA family hydrolase [Thiohalomonadales bacterium]
MLLPTENDAMIEAAQIKLILFDLGGVLIDLDFQRCLDYWGNVNDVELSIVFDKIIDDEQYRLHEIDAIDFNAFYRHISAKFGLSLTEQQFQIGWNRVLLGIVPDIETLLQRIEPSISLAIFSNTNWTHEDHWRREFVPLWPYFDSIFTSNRLKIRKPDTDAYLQVLVALHADPQQVIFFDDSLVNINGARAAGIKHSYLVKNNQDISRILDIAGLLERA